MKSKNASSASGRSSSPIVNERPYVGRFAPSPTGPLHQGSLLAALASYLDARAANGRWLLRIEDVDRSRTIAGAADQILRSLEAHGLYWDGEVSYQSPRDRHYESALEQLKNQHQVFFWSRATRVQ